MLEINYVFGNCSKFQAHHSGQGPMSDYPAHVKQCGSNQLQQGMGCVFNCRKMFLFVFMSVNFRAWFNSTFVCAHFKCSSAIFFWCSESEFDFNCFGAETQILWINEINSMVTNVLIPCITRTLKAMILKCRKNFVLVLYEEGKNTCAISRFRNYRKCKYISMFN